MKYKLRLVTTLLTLTLYHSPAQAQLLLQAGVRGMINVTPFANALDLGKSKTSETTPASQEDIVARCHSDRFPVEFRVSNFQDRLKGTNYPLLRGMIDHEPVNQYLSTVTYYQNFKYSMSVAYMGNAEINLIAFDQSGKRINHPEMEQSEAEDHMAKEVTFTRDNRFSYEFDLIPKPCKNSMLVSAGLPVSRITGKMLDNDEALRILNLENGEGECFEATFKSAKYPKGIKIDCSVFN